jgi:hypothetical protein
VKFLAAVVIKKEGKKKYLIMGYQHLLSIGAMTVAHIRHNGLHKTSKGMREMNYQDTTQFKRATMLNNLLKPLLVLCGVIGCLYS